VQNFQDFAGWILGNPNNGWRNVVYISSPTDPTYSSTTQLILPPDFDPSDQIQITISCVFAAGASVSFSASTPTSPPIVLEWNDISQDFITLGSVPISVPVGFQTNITYSVRTNGKNFSDKFNVELNFNLIPSVASPFWRYGKTAEELNMILPPGVPRWNRILVLGSTVMKL